MKLIYCLLLFALLILPIVAADEPEIRHVFKQNTYVTLSDTCTDRDNPCNPSTTCYASITNPNGTIVASNSTMQIYHYPYWSINLSSGMNSMNGIYKVNMYCNTSDGFNGTTPAFYYQITPSGDNNLTNLMFVILGVGIILLLFGFWKEDYYTLIFSGIALIIVGLYFLLNGVDVYRNSTTYSISIIIIFFGCYVAGRSGISLVEEAWG